MTWKEFKAEVDKQLKEKGISENMEILYIDTDTFDIEVKFCTESAMMAIT